MSNNTPIYFTQGGAELVIGAGGTLTISGGAVAPSGGQAAAIDDISVTGTYATDDTPIETAINSILAALRDAGIIAAS